MPTLDEVFASERAWIAGCDDVDALHDKIAEWRRDARTAQQHGDQLARMRCGDLVELGQQRVVRLKAVALRAEEARSKPSQPTNRPPATEQGRAPVINTPLHDDSADRMARLQVEVDASRAGQRKAERERVAAEAVAAKQAGEAAMARRAVDEATKALAHQRKAGTPASSVRQPGMAAASAAGTPRPSGATAASAARTGMATARSAMPVAQPTRTASTPKAGPPLTGHVKQSLDLRRVQADAPGASAASAQAARGPTTVTAASAPPPTAPRAPLPATQPDLARAISEAIVARLAAKPPAYDLAKSDREALESAGRFPIPGPKNPKGPWRPDDEWPEEWTLTGFDLAVFRGRVRVTQKVLAGQLGVEQGTISKAEAAVKAKLGPTLQVALRKAIDDLNKSPDRPRREGA